MDGSEQLRASALYAVCGALNRRVAQGESRCDSRSPETVGAITRATGARLGCGETEEKAREES